MPESIRWGAADLAALFIVLVLGGGARFWYVAVCADGGQGTPALQAEGQWPRPTIPRDIELGDAKPSTELNSLVQNLKDHGWFGGKAPLADKEETTSHVAPAYPWLMSTVARLGFSVDAAMRWAQAGLGTLAVACYFFFARRAFQSLFVGFLAGVFVALHPFWIVNTAELTNGVLTTFLLAASLMLGTRASQEGGAFVSLLYGLALAGLAMTRAALLPFALVALLWFLLRCRNVRAGWLCGLLAFLGFGNGLAPWTVRNFRVFSEPVPLVDSAMLHLWIGNNPLATGGNLDENDLRKSLPSERLEALLAEPNQAKRYNSLAQDVIREVGDDPGNTVSRRLWAGLLFVFGENWFKKENLAQTTAGTEVVAPPDWLTAISDGVLRADLLAMLILGLLGWRFSFGWRKQARLATLAALWIPVPYLLTHADYLSGPRLPLDGVWLCFAAFAVACAFPGVRRQPVKMDGSYVK